MVDTAIVARTGPPQTDPAPLAAQESTADAHIMPADPAALATYAAFADIAVAGPAQSGAWVGAWTQNLEPDAFIATLTSAGRPVLSLFLEITRHGPFRIARFPGGSHANGNFPALAQGAAVTSTNLQVLIDAVHKARPDIDMLLLERLAGALDDTANPLLQLPHQRSPNLALAVDLGGGFDAMLERTGGKRKRKKHRSQTRKFEASGGFRFVEARNPEQVDRLLDAFFAMKEQRFRKMGIADVFAPRPVRGFFRDLFMSSLTGRVRQFSLEALEVRGSLRAVTGSSRCGSRLICEFGAIAEDELAHASPGDFLFFENIRQAADRGFQVYDFSVGDETYKRRWCDVEIVQYDVLVALSARGSLYGAGLAALGRAKRLLKGTPLLWRLFKAMRRRVGETAPSSDLD